MRFRKLPPLPPKIEEPTEVEAARAIATAINQGLPGDQFCRLLNVMDPKKVQLVAGLELGETMDWFKENDAAAAILDATPGFRHFCEVMHQTAHELYPNRGITQ